ncbi:MAG: hypothetical protein JSU87_16240 [Gemmatimonadota bacterium]|nr:MAG: hypothetical protein JSU87_16240 [Gemmatimonadota bacterium]
MWLDKESLRGPLIVVEVLLLAVITALVDDAVLRVSLALIVAFLLARAALSANRSGRAEGRSVGPDERRQDHLFRHWVNVLLKKVREFHTVCQGISSGGVNLAVGQLRLEELEREIQDLINQATESAKPARIKKGRYRSSGKPERRREAYGELPDDE